MTKERKTRSELFRRSWFVSWMCRVLMGVAEIKISQVNRQGKQRAQNSDRIVAIEGEIDQQQYRSDRTALPKTEWNNTLPRAFRGDPLNDEAQTEDHAAREANHLPGRERNVIPGRRGEGEEHVHTARLTAAAARLPSDFSQIPSRKSGKLRRAVVQSRP